MTLKGSDEWFAQIAKKQRVAVARALVLEPSVPLFVQLRPIVLSLPHRSLDDGEIEVAVRPEAIQFHAEGPAGLPATVKKASYLGQLMEYTLATPVGDLFAISTAVEAPLAIGQSSAVRLANHGVAVIPPSTATP